MNSINSENKKVSRHLRALRQWAKAKIADGHEPPWAWYQYMKLIETIDTILENIASVTTMESSQQLEVHRGAHLQLVGSIFQQDKSQHHSSDVKVSVPM